MAVQLRDYSNGQDKGWANLINAVNDRAVAAEEARREHLETMGKIGLAFAVGNLIQNLVESRRRNKQ